MAVIGFMKKVFKVLLNKYLLTGLFCSLRGCFHFDQNDWMSQRLRKKELQAEKDNIAYLQKEIDEMEKENVAIPVQIPAH